MKTSTEPLTPRAGGLRIPERGEGSGSERQGRITPPCGCALPLRKRNSILGETDLSLIFE